MSNGVRCFLSLAATLVLLVTGAPQPVGADGGVITIEREEVEMPSQKAILVYDEKSGHEDLILSVELLGGSEAAWVVPVPSLPEVKAAAPHWFEQLSELTAPRIEYRDLEVVNGRWEDGVCVIRETVAETVVEPVELLSREQVGIYDVSILSADEPGALLDWLNENGYAFPEEGGPLLDAYVEEGGWYFVAARVLPGESATLEGDVQPLWFSFDAERPVYPMRLTALMKDKVHVLIYVLADHRMEIAAHEFSTQFAGELVLQPRSEEADLLNLLTNRPYYVTKLVRWDLYAPELTEDLYPQRASSDAAYREVIYVDRTVSVCPPLPTATARPLVSRPLVSRPLVSRPLVLGVSLALLALLTGLAMAWRRRSRRKPDEETKVRAAHDRDV
jgi:hypothetical protein